MPSNKVITRVNKKFELRAKDQNLYLSHNLFPKNHLYTRMYMRYKHYWCMTHCLNKALLSMGQLELLKIKQEGYLRLLVMLQIT